MGKQAQVLRLPELAVVAVPKPQAEMAALLGEAANQELLEASAKAAMVVSTLLLLAAVAVAATLAAAAAAVTTVAPVPTVAAAAAAAQASTLQVVPVHKVFRQVMAK